MTINVRQLYNMISAHGRVSPSASKLLHELIFYEGQAAAGDTPIAALSTRGVLPSSPRQRWLDARTVRARRSILDYGEPASPCRCSEPWLCVTVATCQVTLYVTTAELLHATDSHEDSPGDSSRNGMTMHRQSFWYARVSFTCCACRSLPRRRGRHPFSTRSAAPARRRSEH